MEEKVVEINLGIVPEAAVSGAFLMQDEYKSILTFNAMRLESSGKYVDVGTAIIQIVGCLLTKFGYPNDEALGGHPLYEKGLNHYGIYEVLNSNWILEQEEQNRKRFPNTEHKKWKRHFVFSFHDSTFECIAEKINLEISNDPFQQTLQRLAEKFV